MKYSILVLALSMAVITVECQGPRRSYRPMRRGHPPLSHRRDLAHMAGPPYAKRNRQHVMVSRPKKHISSTGLVGHPSIYSSVYKYPPPPHSRPYMAGPPKSSFYSRPYGSPHKYPYYNNGGNKPVGGFSKKQRQPYEKQVPRETIAHFGKQPSSNNKGTPILTYNSNSKTPTVTYGSPNKQPYNNNYGSSEESSAEDFYGSQKVGASIKYGKATPGASPAHPSLLDPEVNIKFPGPSFSSANHAYKTINEKPTQEETSVVRYPTSDGKRRKPQEASQSTKLTVSRPYSTLKFPAADSSESSDASSYQNYDHFLQETFAPDLTKQSETYSKTKQQKKSRGKSRYRPTQGYQVKDDSEERGDFYTDSETVEDY